MIKVGKIIGKDDILTVEEKRVSLIGSNTTRSLILVQEYFTYPKKFVKNYKKMSTPGPVPKNWLGFSYIWSED